MFLSARLALPLLLALAAPAWSGSVGAAELLAGPVPATLVRVVDGDTLEVEARIWLGHNVRTLVRLRGVDTPELHGACARERDLAALARDHLARQLAPGLELRDIGRDKYGGRVVARVAGADGRDAATALIAAGLGHAYGGGHKAAGWCEK